MTGTKPKTGELAPDFIVFDSQGNEFRLSGNTGNGKNVLMLLYRGHW